MNNLIYARVSTEEQANTGKSIDTQITLCNKLAEERNLGDTEVFKDEGISGTKYNRPSLQELLTQVAEGNVSHVLVQDTDRLARDTYDYLKIRAILRKHDTKLISVNQPHVEGYSPESLLIDEVLAAINAFQPRVTGRKVKSTMKEKAKRGYWPSYANYGYKNIENPSPISKFDMKIIKPNKEESFYVKRAFELYTTKRFSIKELTKKLNKEGMRTRWGNKVSTSFIHDMLKKTNLQGVSRVGRCLYRGS